MFRPNEPARYARAVRLLGAFALSALLFAPVAAAAEPLDQPAMQRELHVHFEGEKAEGVPFMSAGLVAFAVGSFLFSRRTAIARGAAWPIVIVGVIETAAGLVVYSRTDAQVARLDAQMASDPGGLKKSELARMKRVNLEFVLLKWTELALAVAGVGLTTYGIIRDDDTFKGAGIGLAAQATVMLVLDLFAADRAARYTDALDRFHVAWTTTSPKELGILSIETRF
jgi:hypothetical protein